MEGPRGGGHESRHYEGRATTGGAMLFRGLYVGTQREEDNIYALRAGATALPSGCSAPPLASPLSSATRSQQQQQQQQQQHSSRPSRGVLRTPAFEVGDEREHLSQLQVRQPLPLPCFAFPRGFGVRSCSRSLVVLSVGFRLLSFFFFPFFVMLTVCLLSQSVDPRLHLWRLLLLGGDVEPNPGPVCCGVCGKSCTGRGPRCGECCGWMHLGCSGLRRDVFYGMEGREEQGWRGRCCASDGTEVRGVEVPESCAACRVRLRGPGVQCVDCGLRVHSCCTGVSSWRRRGMVDWRCSGCVGGAVASPERAEPSVEVTAGGDAGVEAGVSVESQPCAVCRVRLRRGVASMMCDDCGVVAHKKCSGMSRWARDRGELWRCSGCSAGAMSVNGAGAEDRALPPELPAGKCDVCRRLRRRGQGIRCCVCERVIHVRCAELGTRGRAQAIDRSVWECAACRVQSREREDDQGSVVEPAVVAGGEVAGSITVMQWNCDHLSSRIPELEVWLRKNDVDVAVVQETKLRGEDGDVCVSGYEMVRRDRWRGGRSRFSRGGGLVTLVRRGWAYRELACGVARDCVVEALSVEVVSPLGSVWRVLNLYVPPESVTGACEEALAQLRVFGSDESWLVCGDLNGHHRAWDRHVPANVRGLQVLSWSEERELVLMNDGSVTRCGRGTASKSAPDVTFCSPQVFESLQWRVVRELGSDHFPILIQGRAADRATGKGTLVWDWEKAEWEAYKEEIRGGLSTVDWDSLGVREYADRFKGIVLAAARRCIRMKRRGGRARLVGEEAESEIRARDELRQREVTDWEAVSEAEHLVREKLREARRGRWRSMLEKGASVGEMWSVVRGVRRRKETGGRSGEMLQVNDRMVVTARAKANAFVALYASVSRVRVPRERRLKSRVNGVLRSPGPEPEDSAPITLSEVSVALADMEEGKAAGPDGLHPRLLGMLPVEALSVVCGLFNCSLRSTVVPQCWRVGEIVPMLKAGKDPADMGSYRPVCLTSCLGKWLERVLGNRIRWVLESAGLLSVFQAGFRKGRGVNDQLVRLSQAVWDGYQRREKTCLVLYDLERAFDRVWHDGLLLKLIETGVSRTVVRWVQEWLKNRLYWVRVEGVRGRRRLFREGLPQGSVLSPLLFLVYINDLVEGLAGGGVEVSAFADDLAVWHTGKGVEEGRRRVQWATDAVADWCREWLMTVSVNKCTVTLFSNDVRDREMGALSVRLNGCELRREKAPRFLGVTYDVGFTFREHVARVVSKAAVGVRLMRCLSGCDWGWCRSLLRTTYFAVVRAVLLFGSAAWAPWVSATVWASVERVQLEAARVIGGTLRSAPREAVLSEADLCPVRRVAESLWMCELEKCLRAPEGDPRRAWGLSVVRRRLVRRTDWRTAASGLLREIVPEGVSRDGWWLGDCPWREWSDVEWLIDGARSGDVLVDRDAAVSRLRSLGAVDLLLYTDGSAVEGVRCGGAAAVVTRGDPEEPERLALRSCAAGVVASSFQAEVVALRVALEWLSENAGAWEHAVVVSDSQAALRALKGIGGQRVCAGLAKVVGLGRELCAGGKRLAFVWVPGHVGLVGNEWADVAAGAAAAFEQRDVGCMFSSIRSLCRRRESVEFEHDRCRSVYGEGMKRDLERDWERVDAVSMARLRSGHSLELGGYRRRIGLEGSGTCRRCGTDAVESVEHVMSCVAGERKRIELGLSDRLSVLCCRPREALAYWRWWRRVRLK